MEASAFPSINPLVLGLTGGTQGWSMGNTGGSDKWLLTKWYCCASTRLLISAGLTPQMTFQNVACIPHHNRILVFLSHAALTNHSWQFTYVPWSTGLGTGGGFSLNSQGCFLHHHCPYPDPPSKVRTPSLLCIPVHALQLQLSYKLLSISIFHQELWPIIFSCEKYLVSVHCAKQCAV